jgi:hypothetical protein
VRVIRTQVDLQMQLSGARREQRAIPKTYEFARQHLRRERQAQLRPDAGRLA